MEALPTGYEGTRRDITVIRSKQLMCSLPPSFPEHPPHQVIIVASVA